MAQQGLETIVFTYTLQYIYNIDLNILFYKNCNP